MARDAGAAPTEETPPTDVTSLGASASGARLPMAADVKKTGGCKPHTVEHSDSVGPTVRLGGNSNQRMGAGLDPLVAAPRHDRIDPAMRPTRPRTAPPDARDTPGPPSNGRRIGPPLATVAAGPAALAMRGFRGTSSSPKTMGRVLVLLAMLSTASGWQLLSFEESEAPESPITGGVDGARPRRLSEDQVAFDCAEDFGVLSTGCTTGCAACADDEYSAASTSLVARVPWPSRQAAHARAPCRAAAPSQAVAPPCAVAHQPTVHARARRFGREAMQW